MRTILLVAIDHESDNPALPQGGDWNGVALREYIEHEGVTNMRVFQVTEFDPDA
jgi:hypothetical protein